MENLKVKNTSKTVKLAQKLRKVNAMIAVVVHDLHVLGEAKHFSDGDQSIYYTQLADAERKLETLLKRRVLIREHIIGMMSIDPFGCELKLLPVSKQLAMKEDNIHKTFKFYETKYGYLSEVVSDV